MDQQKWLRSFTKELINFKCCLVLAGAKITWWYCPMPPCYDGTEWSFPMSGCAGHCMAARNGGCWNVEISLDKICEESKKDRSGRKPSAQSISKRKQRTYNRLPYNRSWKERGKDSCWWKKSESERKGKRNLCWTCGYRSCYTWIRECSQEEIWAGYFHHACKTVDEALQLKMQIPMVMLSLHLHKRRHGPLHHWKGKRRYDRCECRCSQENHSPLVAGTKVNWRRRYHREKFHWIWTKMKRALPNGTPKLV